MRFVDWCFKAHIDTNHYYDEYVQYPFHLKMTMQAAKDFFHIMKLNPEEQATVLCACAGHDLYEDARKTYNDVLHAANTCDEVWSTANARQIAELIFAVSNNTGRNRSERADAAYYAKIRNTPLAKYVKLCDKIASVRYSVMAKSPKLKMHIDEHKHFLEEMKLEDMYKPMVDHLEDLLFR